MVKKLMNADINELFKQKSVEIEQIEQYKENFQKLIREALPDREKRYVFFIDDLDRLSPDKALEVLEVIELFFDAEQCVFILAIDYDVIVDGVRRKYGENFKNLAYEQLYKERGKWSTVR